MSAKFNDKDATLKRNVLQILRWVFFLPLALGGAFLFLFIVNLLSGWSGVGYDLSLAPKSSLWRLVVMLPTMIFGSCGAGYMFVTLCSAIVPKFKRIISMICGILLSTVYGVIITFVIIAYNMNRVGGWELTNSIVVCSLTVCGIIIGILCLDEDGEMIYIHTR